MAEEVLVDLTPLAQKNGITLTQTGENVQLTGSDVLLYRVLFNLTENAIKYNRTGGSVELSVKQEHGQAAAQWAAWDWDWRSCRRLSGCMAAQCALNRAQIREQQFW